MAQVNEVVRNNFAKVVEWIKATYLHAIESSYGRNIKCDSVHHVYHTAYINIYNGEVYFVRGSHGNGSSSSTYDPITKRWYDRLDKPALNNHNDLPLEEFMHEWREQKHYIMGTLQPYEDMYKFEV